jgi:predicted Zn-ribbon and HTH transcriptional regulator
MHPARNRDHALEELLGVLSDADEPLTAREILARIRERDGAESVETTHRIATVLGRAADADDAPVEVRHDSPYCYRLRR